jgi:NYN domain-containing protein/OST-HTH/LOTUS domain-containing protein
MYWDFENIHASLYELDVGPYKEAARFKPQPELIDVAAIMDFARSVGSVCINRAYCNWSFFFRYSDALSGVGMELVQLFPRGLHGKNGADIKMCVDMVEDLLRLDVDVCIIVSGDSDFIGVAQKARQYGKRVIGIGVRDFSNRFFQRVCDEFKFYDMLVQAEVATPVTIEGSGKMRIESAKSLLVAAVSRLATQFGEPAVLKARVKPMMLRLEPAFDERGVIAEDDDAGFANFSAFLSACMDVIEEQPGEGDHTIKLRTGVVEAATGAQMSDETREKSRRLLVAAMTFMLRNRDSVQMAALKVMMMKLEPGFDEKKVGAKNLLSFLQRFPDIVAIHGEGAKRMVELLVEKNEGGYEPPPQAVLPPLEVFQAVMPFHFESLREKPAEGWPEYYDRLKAAVDAAGFAIERSGLQGIKKVMMDAKALKMLPNQRGVTLAENFASVGELWNGVTEQLARGLQSAGAASDGTTTKVEGGLG